MHCPRCGHALLQVPRDLDAEREEAWALWRAEKAAAGFRSGPPPDFDESEHYECKNPDCVLEDMLLQVHHPLRGVDSRPGDSFSITYLE